MDLSLASVLNSKEFQRIISNCREFRDRIYTPFKTLFIFIKQVLDTDKSCKKAVAGVVAEQLSVSGREISSNTGPYCKAISK